MAILVNREIAIYDDSVQPTGGTKVDGFPPLPHFEMKKLHHSLHLVISGPEGADVSACLQQAGYATFIAAVAAVAVTGGAAATAAFEAGVGVLTQCLGDKFQVSMSDQSNWETWWT